LAYTSDSLWRNRNEFVTGRAEIEAFLTRKWQKELDYRLIKEIWAYSQTSGAGTVGICTTIHECLLHLFR